MSVDVAQACTVQALIYRDVVRLSSRARPDDLARAIAQHTGVAPGPCQSAALADDGRILWREPGVWLLVGDSAKTLGAAVAGDAACVLTDISGALATWTVRGAGWRTLLSMGCPLDVERMAPGAAAATLFGPVEVLIDVCEEAKAELYVARSFAVDFDATLRRAAARVALPCAV